MERSGAQLFVGIQFGKLNRAEVVAGAVGIVEQFVAVLEYHSIFVYLAGGSGKPVVAGEFAENHRREADLVFADFEIGDGIHTVFTQYAVEQENVFACPAG